MLQWLRRKWLFATVVTTILVASLLLSTLAYHRTQRARHAEPELPPKGEAPPDLQKLRDPYAAGMAALQRNDGTDAVRHLSSFSFAPRPVEEYRLYYLANGYQLAGNSDAARRTLVSLWRRNPRLVYASDVAFNLAGLHAATGNVARSADVYAALAARPEVAPAAAASARWRAATARLRSGDLAAAVFMARQIVITHPATGEAKQAAAFVRAVYGLDAEARIPLTPSERLQRAVALRDGGNAERALAELEALGSVPSLDTAIQLEKGLTLHALRRFEDSNEQLEPLTSGAYKYAIPALRHTARNYAVLAAAIDPEVTKTVREKKRVGSVKVKVGKGKKRRTVTRPKYRTVSRQVKLVDLARKERKERYDRLASERLKDLLALPLDEEMRLDVLSSLLARAQEKNQSEYMQELVPQIIRIDSVADPALQFFWDKAWAAYMRRDLATAKSLFRFIFETYTHTNVRRQAEYWYARTVGLLGDEAEAKRIYQKLADAPYEDLYAQHAISRGAKRTPKGSNPLKSAPAEWAEIAAKEMPDELRLAWELTALSAMRDAYLEIRRNASRENARFAEALLADYYAAAGSQVLMYRSLRKAWPQLATVDQDEVPPYFLRMYYPLRYQEEIVEHSKDRSLDPNLVRALILQESYYNPEARSSVGATGLMQLMPPTAKEHAARLRIPFALSRLENPDVNIRLGTFHLRMLMRMFDGNAYLAVASYNAGQGNVMKWRRAAPNRPLDEFLESIPFQETRNYVKRVTLLRSAYTRLTS